MKTVGKYIDDDTTQICFKSTDDTQTYNEENIARYGCQNPDLNKEYVDHDENADSNSSRGYYAKGFSKLQLYRAKPMGRKGGMNDPTSIADQLKISGTQIITLAFIGTGQSDVVLNLGNIASPRMNFTTLRQRDLTGKILDGLCQGEISTPLPNHHMQLNDLKFHSAVETDLWLEHSGFHVVYGNPVNHVS
ncbi:hypothetical protein ANCDUO_15261 [Ancylostoma duodenale]|uniref:Uncharacterized protein n=1 Tax=Ancylostoma duodenale TaxID=51022 RepID=A0A0C2CXL6_9BILA|nr:hypothetical protein ANCDUO_15261 [Ancylostoma duodenale]